MIAWRIDWYPILHQRSKIFFFLTIVFRFPSSFQLSSGYLWKKLRYCLAKGSIKKLSLLVKNRNKKIVVFYFSCFFFFTILAKRTLSVFDVILGTDLLNKSNAGDVTWSWIPRDFIQVQKEEGKFVVVCPRPPWHQIRRFHVVVVQ